MAAKESLNVGDRIYLPFSVGNDAFLLSPTLYGRSLFASFLLSPSSAHAVIKLQY